MTFPCNLKCAWEFRPDRMIRAESIQVDGGVHAVDITLIQLPAQQLDGFTEPLEMDDLPLPQELDHIIDIGIIRKPQDVVVSDPCLLLWHMKFKANG